MSTKKDLNAAICAARDALIDGISAHEKECHDGEVCVPERANALAFLAHSIGLDEARYFGEVLARAFEIRQRHETEPKQ